MARLKLNAWGGEHEITFTVEHYQINNNLAIQMWCWDTSEIYPEPWSMLTVNLTKKCKPNCAFIDINNNGEHILMWLEKNKLGMQTGNFEVSGYCIYPEFEFNMDELNKYVEVSNNG